MNKQNTKLLAVRVLEQALELEHSRWLRFNKYGRERYVAHSNGFAFHLISSEKSDSGIDLTLTVSDDKGDLAYLHNREYPNVTEIYERLHKSGEVHHLPRKSIEVPRFSP